MPAVSIEGSPTPSDPQKLPSGWRTLQEWAEAHQSEIRAALRNKVARHCRGEQDSWEIARELMGEFFTSLHDSAHNYDPNRPPQFRALKVATFVARRWVDRTYKDRERTMSLYAESEETDELWDRFAPPSGVRRLEDAVLGDLWVQNILKECNEPDRAILIGIVLEQRSAEEVGAEIRMNAGTVRVRVSRLLARLRVRMGKERSGSGSGRAFSERRGGS